jgi:hypothetical protein
VIQNSRKRGKRGKRGELLFSHMAPKVPPKFSSPTKPPKSSTMTQEERDEIFHQI